MLRTSSLLPPTLVHALAAEISSSMRGRPQWSAVSTGRLRRAFSSDAAHLAAQLAPGGKIDTRGTVHLTLKRGSGRVARWFDPATGLFGDGEATGRGFIDFANFVWSDGDAPLSDDVARERIAGLIGCAALACFDRGTLIEAWS